MGERVLLVYNADGGLLGEAVYFLKKGLGIAKCELCSITHRGLSERADWKACKGTIDAEVLGVHRNELTEREREFIADRYPCVIGDRKGKLTLVLGPAQFSAMGPQKLAEAIRLYLDARLDAEEHDR